MPSRTRTVADSRARRRAIRCAVRRQPCRPRVNATHYEVTHAATGSHAEGQGTRDGGEWPEAAAVRRLASCAGRWPRVIPSRRSRPASPAGHYRLEGLWPYNITANGELYIPQLNPMRVGARRLAKGSPGRSTNSSSARSTAMRCLVGNARWSREESWPSRATSRTNPAELRPSARSTSDCASGAPFGGENPTLPSAILRQAARQRRRAAAGGEGRRNWRFDAFGSAPETPAWQSTVSSARRM